MRTRRIFIVLIGLAAFAPSVAGQGQLSFERAQHDFGALGPDVRVETSFRFVNTGDRPLQIKYVTASCGCTSPHHTREEVAPGEEGEVRVAFDSRGRSGSFRQPVHVTAEVGADDLVVETVVVFGEVVRELPPDRSRQ